MSSTQLRGWLWSAAIHGAFLGGMVWGGATIPQPEAQEVFQWEVQLTADPSAQVASMEGEAASSRSERLAGESVADPRSVSVKTPAHVTARREATPATASQAKPIAVVETKVIPITSVAVATIGEEVSRVTDAQPMSIDSRSDANHDETGTEVLPGRTSLGAQESMVSDVGAGVASMQGRDTPLSDVGSPEHPTASERAGTRRDFGWVGLALRTRVEEVKRYSLDARLNEWEGRTVIAVEIVADGRILDSRIVESSGNPRLDEDARALVSSVSPLKLAHALDADRLTVKIPIVFGLR